MPFHFVNQATVRQCCAAISQAAFQEDRASFHHTYNRRTMCHDRRAGLLWFHRLFVLAINPSIGTAPYPSLEDIWRRSDLTFQREEDFDELSFDDFLTIHTRGARRTQDHLGCHWGQGGTYPGDTLRIHCDFIINSSRHYPGDTCWNLLQSILHFDHNVSSNHMLITFTMYPPK